jgi:hypothetical protein
VRTLTLEVSDEVYAALTFMGSIAGASPETWAKYQLDWATAETREGLSWRDSGRRGGATLAQSETKQSIQSIRRKAYITEEVAIPERDEWE